MKSHNPSGTEQEIRNRRGRYPLRSGLGEGSLRRIVPGDQLPPGVRVEVLPSRKASRKVIFGSRAITGRLGEVIDPVVHGLISVRLDDGGIFHLEPELVAVLHTGRGDDSA